MNMIFKKSAAILLCAALCANAAACGKNDESASQSGGDNTAKYDDANYISGLNENKRTEFNTELDLSEVEFTSSDLSIPEQFFEAEIDAEYTGNVKVSTPLIPGFTGDAYLEGLNTEGDEIIFTVNIEESGTYDLCFNTGRYSTGNSENYVNVDGVMQGTVTTIAGEQFYESTLSQVYLEAGERKISMTPLNGYIWVDNLTVRPAQTFLNAEHYNVTAELSNENATQETKNLYKFLCDVYGKYTISGQYCDDGYNGATMGEIFEKTGEYPAMLGMDLMEYTPSRVEKSGSDTGNNAIENAMDWWICRGGMVTLSWHWNAPTPYLLNNNEHPWYEGFYADATTIDLDKIINGEDEEGYQLLLDDIAAIAVQLQRLEDAGVPVLWRPLHEAGGNETSQPWFWWGDCEPESYIALWNLLYEQLTEVHGLDNLIWVWNGQRASYYPGDDTVDVIGWDIYAPEHSYSSQSATFIESIGYTNETKIIALTENGVLVDPELAFRDNARWSWFCTWESFMTQFGVGVEKNTEFYMWEKVFQHENVLSLDELPDIANYGG